ncbi:hypothetical protein G647_05790 [Cladophialophora carrionii CBS 160.54]|uniref:Dioxygenase n=1 Tax=Cladophialophora carrionii CBS 160.54 TaxID=1279043 RepID=V9DCF2_9EURO|nr:uncharacterized protein G647_05790 [Cladophialophora carrionii CBS 160.54]ETI23983.1 hypothetical protein G647_05790 [Cladophialophora carrionii CBS 160.54]
MGDAGSLAGAKVAPTLHYNDWPNTLGFDTHYEERTPVELRVEGDIPAYAAGTLFRTGLGPRTIRTSKDADFKVNHWFDNFSQVHRFQIHPPQPGAKARVTYNSRLTSDGLIEKIRKTGKLDGFTFAARYDPCKSFFQKMQAVFQPAQPEPKPNEVNVGVTMSANFPGLSRDGHKTDRPRDARDGMTLCNKTDANMLQFLDPETLEPIGVAHQATLHPALTGVGSGAHAKSDPATGDVFNYNLDFGRTGTYRVWRASASTGKTSILATFQHAPAYIHSLFLTKNYVVLCVWNSYYKAGGASILWTRNLLDAMAWDGKRSTTWFVIDKKSPEEGGKGVIASYESKALFSFHSINAYEEPSTSQQGAVDVICDLVAYENMDVLHHFYLDNIISDLPQAHSARKSMPSTAVPNYRRYRLPGISSTPKTKHMQAMLDFEGSKANAFELPIINPMMVTKKHRYMYGISDTGKSTFVDGLVKYDAETHATLRWSVHGQSPGEPIFVADPQSEDEDGGVLLSVVLDGPGGKSYLLVLDAKTMTEVGRAHVDGAIGFGFHGLHVSSSTPVGRQNGLHL